MNKIYKKFIGLSLLLALTTPSFVFCVPVMAEQAIDKTQLEIREYQTKVYDTKDTKMVIKAIINALQDDGYILGNINNDLGIITATKQSEVKAGKSKFWREVMLYSVYGAAGAAFVKSENTTMTIDSSVNISDFNQQTKIRANFSQKIQTAQNTDKIKQINDEKFYQEFFAKVDKSIFIQKEKI